MGAKNGELRELWGRQFRVVKNGLDEDDVFSFVGNLIEQNNEYAKRLENIESLKRFAEDTVVQANRQAETMVAEAAEKAREASDRAESIVAEAEEKVRNEAQSLIAEAEEKAREANETATSLLYEAEQRANEEARRIVAEAEAKAEELNERASTIISEAEQKARDEAERIVAEAEEKVGEINGNASTIIIEAEQKAKDEAERIVAEAEEKVGEINGNASTIIIEAEQKAKDEAERIVAEAEEKVGEINGNASTIIIEAEQKAREEAERIVAEAEEKVRDINDQASTIISEAEREAQAARQEAEQLLARTTQLTESEIKGKLRKVHQELFAALGLEEPGDAPVSPAEGAATLEPTETECDAPVEHKAMSDWLGTWGQQPASEQEAAEAQSGPEAAAYAPEEAASEASPASEPIVGDEEAEAESGIEETAYAEEEMAAEASQAAQDFSDERRSDDGDGPLYEGDVELNIPPPVALDRLLQLHKNLKQIPEVKVTNLHRSTDKGLKIELSLSRPMPLLAMLKDFPEVQGVYDAPSQAENAGKGRWSKARAALNTITVSVKE